MLPAMWRIEACMNIDVKTVSQRGQRVLGRDAVRVQQPRVAERLRLTRSPTRSAHDLGAVDARSAVSAYGIAPYLNTSCRSGPLKNEPAVPDREEVDDDVRDDQRERDEREAVRSGCCP